MNDSRPNPDQLLQAVKNEGSAKGTLRIYFGYAAGVGKSFAMLKGAHDLRRQGMDVVVGYLEAHGRRETEDLLVGLEIISPKNITQGGATFRELDLEGVLARRPAVVLVDEMAHTNPDGCRHPKRWQDIEEILSAGISVYTTLNVQHLESLNDIIAQITGTRVRETLPDAVFDRADEVTLLDITPDELLKRFRAGKVYKGAQAEVAMGNYFKKSNLVALREIALRRTAERVHADVTQARLTANIQAVVPTQERLGCIIDTDEASASALRTTARLAGLMACPWSALEVESARQVARLPREEARLQNNLKLAEELGAKVVHRSGIFRFSEIIRWAREENITKLVVARPRSYHLLKWLERLVIFFVGRELDILWVHAGLDKNGGVSEEIFAGDKDAQTDNRSLLKEQNGSPEISRKSSLQGFPLRPYLETTGIVFVTFWIAALLGALHTPEANLTVIYLLGVIVAAVIHGEGASAWAAFLSALILSVGLTNFTFRVSWMNAQYLINFGLSLGIGLMASQMTSRLKTQAERARQEREKTEALYNFSTALSAATGLHQIAASAQTLLRELFKKEVVLFLQTDAGVYAPLIKNLPAKNSASGLPAQNKPLAQLEPAELGLADWCARHRQPAGAGTQTLPQAAALYLPLVGNEEVVGVLAIARGGKQMPPKEFYERFAQTLAGKIESAFVTERAEKLFWQAERERLRGDLISSVSQGLKTPLEVLAATSESLLEDHENRNETKTNSNTNHATKINFNTNTNTRVTDTLSDNERHEMLTLIRDEAFRLQRLVDNLTQLERFEQQQLPVHRQKMELNEFIQAEVFKLKRANPACTFSLGLFETPIPVQLDPFLFAQVISNIVDNAVEYTPRAGVITLGTMLVNGAARLMIEDEGEGLPEEQLEKIFEKYYRLSSRSRGAGLGLTVCRAIVEAHGARLWAENKRPRGLRLVVEMKG